MPTIEERLLGSICGEILDYPVKGKKPDGYRRAEEQTHTRSAAVLVGVGFIVIAIRTYLFF